MTRVAGLLLAAGGSTRFGEPKQLLAWDGLPLVAHAADVILAAGLDPVGVVIGCRAADVRAALDGRSIGLAMNWRWEEGLSTSVQAGLALLPPDVDAAVFVQCDQPLLTSHLLRRLVDRFEQTRAPIVYPAYEGRRGAPMLVARSLFPELAATTGDRGGRALLDRYGAQAACVDVDDPLVLQDIDTPDDYRRLLAARTSADQLESLRRIRHLIVDMDGVLWRGDEPLPGLGSFFDFLRERQIPFILATNNASRRSEEYVAKLARMGVDVPVESILNSGEATAAYLAQREPPGAPVYVIGAPGLRSILAERGFEIVDDGARYVVVGFTPLLDWNQLAAATLQIHSGAILIGANPDVTFPSEKGLVPGNGATLAALVAATGVRPVVVGKPEPWLYREALSRMGAEPETTAVIGDRLDTDIAGGVRVGLLTILVLSGITTRADLAASSVRSDIVCDGIAALTQVWRALDDGPPGEGSERS